MISLNRFRVPGDPAAFRAQAEVSVEQFRGSAGCLSAELVQNLDEPELWAIVSRWRQVGDYRRAFSGVAARMTLIPLLSLAIDEPGAYAETAEVGQNLPRGTIF